MTPERKDLHMAACSAPWLHLMCVNLIVFGVEVCASASFIYVPPIMLKMGYTETAMTITMGVGPLVSLILVPGIGRWSDRLGGSVRRLPFIAVLSVLLLAGLILIPYANDISPNLTILALAIGVILLDFTTQALLNPCKALVSDLLLNYQCPQQGFTMYGCMLSSGSCVGYLVASIGWEHTFLGKWFGSQEKIVFLMLSSTYVVILFFTLILLGGRNPASFLEEPIEILSLDCSNNSELVKTKKPAKIRVALIPTGKDKPNEMYASTFLSSLLLSSRTLFCSLWSFVRLPSYLLRLFVANAFAWMAMHCHDSYYTDFVGKVIYGGNPDGQTEYSQLYDEGVRMGSWGLLLQSVTATIYAGFIQQRLIQIHGQKRIFLLGLSSFTLCMIGTLSTNNILLVNFLTLASGPGFAALTTIPCDIITGYHDQIENFGVSNQRGVGEDMAVIDSASSLAQVFPSFFLGFLVISFGSASVYVIFSAVCGLAACGAALLVTYTDDMPSNKIAHL